MGYIQEIYDLIMQKSNTFGTYHKCLFHIHTPASGDDYATLERYRNNHGENIGKGKRTISHSELRDLCAEKELFTRETFDLITSKLYDDNKDYYKKDIDEMIKYLLIAWEMIINNIEIAVIADHNVIDGFEPLNRALGILYENYNNRIKRRGYNFPILLLGIEISCADTNHIVGIFDNKKKKEVEQFIKKNIMSPQDGTYYTSIDIIKKIAELGGIPYIAHIDTSNVFKKDFLTKIYKKTLFNLPELNAIGFNYKMGEHSNDSRNNIKDRIKRIATKEFAYFIDADSHSIDTIKNRHFYIKGKKCNFEMIKDAIIDSDVAISFEIPMEPKCYIGGIYIENQSNRGFLTNGENAYKRSFFLPMSTSLNCLIGGRGTGKSTILNIIEGVLGQNFLDENVFNAIFEYDKIGILISYEEDKYLVLFMPREKKYEKDTAYEDLMRIAEERNKSWWYKSSSFKRNLQELKPIILRDCIQIFKVAKGQIVIENEISKSMMSKFYDRYYSVNELVKTASSSEIDNFIYDLMEMNPDMQTRHRSINSKEALTSFLNNFEKCIKKREEQVIEKINKFNQSKSVKKKICITYRIQDLRENIFDFEEIFNNYKGIRINKETYVQKTNLSIEGLISFLERLCKKRGAVHFARLIMNHRLLDEYAMLSDFATEYNQKLIDNSLNKVTKENSKALLNHINDYMLNNGVNVFMSAFSNDYLRRIEFFSLQFNIMNKEGERQKAVFRDVKLLSLGQKVVAMLSFVFGYSDFIHDYRPLVIDQPEDNLDNQYIFKNLVNDLRQIKGKRQVIIATHSSTIVTNAKAEQVIVMKSDGGHGWVADKGYVSDNRIKQNIINYMEGGVASFKHKINIYKDVLK